MSADFKVATESGTASAALELIRKAKIPDLLALLGQTVVDQTRDRILFEKKAPDGGRWAAWSRQYALRRQGVGSLLLQSSDLVNSIEYTVRSKQVAVGSDLPYAGVHQKGSRKKNIEARPYLGISKANERELIDVVAKWMRGLVK